MNWYFKVLKSYAVFSGRARRQELWMFALFNIIAAFFLSAVDSVIFGTAFEELGPLYIIYLLGIITPSLAVQVRRLHDIGKSGWWFLITLIPLIGSIWLLVLLVTDSQPGSNQYGPNPKGV